MSTFSPSKNYNNTGGLFKQTRKCPQTCSEELIGNLGIPRRRLRKRKSQTVMVFGVLFASEMLPYLLPQGSLRHVSILTISATGLNRDFPTHEKMPVTEFTFEIEMLLLFRLKVSNWQASAQIGFCNANEILISPPVMSHKF